MNWLLLRGLSRESRHWGPFPEHLQKLYPDSHVERIDLPGTGTEYSRSSPDSISEIVEDLRSRWKDARDESWGIIGISMGGMAALDWSHRYPKAFQRRILINSSASNLSPWWHRIRPSAIVTAAQLLLPRTYEERERWILERTTTISPELIDGLAKRWAEFAKTNPCSLANVASQLRASARFDAPAGDECPTLVLSGGKDRFTSPECSLSLARHLHAQLETHPEGGHDLPLQFPEWVAERIAAFATDDRLD